VKSLLQSVRRLAEPYFEHLSERHAAGARTAPTAAGFAASKTLQVLAALALVAVATAVLFVARDMFAVLNLVSIIYLLPVVIAAVSWGMLPAIVAALAGVAAADFFFYPPFFSFVLEDPQNVADLVVFLIVALVTGDLAARLKRETLSLRRREREITGLYAFSKQLVACFTVSDLIRATEEYLTETLGRPARLVETADIERGAAASDAIPERVWNLAASIAAHSDVARQTVIDDATQHAWLVRGVALGTTQYAVMVDLGSGPREANGTLDRQVDAVLEEASRTLARLDLAKAIDDARLQAQADALKDALIGSMSHDLRNPLASILGAASVLDQLPGIKADTRAHALVETVHQQAARLDNEVQYFLDAARMTAPGVQPTRQWTDPVDIVNAAIDQRRMQLAAHRVELSIAPDLPLVHVQSALVEQALGQLLENAAKYSPAGSTVKVAAQHEQGRVVIAVSDQGVGLTDDEKGQLGQRAFRGGRYLASVPGAGLGLWVANNFITLNGGTLEAQSAGPGLGTTMFIRLPAAPDEDGGRTDAVA
jgi:K+-sensing histidine kinase KdpD